MRSRISYTVTADHFTVARQDERAEDFRRHNHHDISKSKIRSAYTKMHRYE